MLLAVIGGSNGYRLVTSDFKGDDLGARKTPYGDSAPVHRVRDRGFELLFLSRHGETGYTTSAPFVNYRANLYALKDMGVTHVVAWSGPGAINPDLKVGTLVLPDDLLDQTKCRPSTYFEGKGLGFVRQNPVFCPLMSLMIEEAMKAEGAEYTIGGTYAVTEGPRLETPAEIRMLKTIGADLVGMTLAPEVFLAKELEMHYGALCYVTNIAEGLSNREFKSGVLFEGLSTQAENERVKQAFEKLGPIVRRLPELIEKQDRAPGCSCETLLERYRKKGLIGSDFREYIN